MSHRLESIQDLAGTVLDRSADERLSLGQVMCLGLEELKEKLGEARWSKVQDLIRKTMDEALEKFLDPQDSWMRARDGSYLIVFGGSDPLVAESKAARISEYANTVLFGSEDTSCITVQGVVETSEGLMPGAKRNPLDIVQSLMSKAKKRSLLPPSLRNAGYSERDEIKTARSTEMPSNRTDLPSRFGIGSADQMVLCEEAAPHGSNRRSPELRSALFQKFEELSGSETEIRYAPVWDAGNERVAIFECVPQRNNPLGGVPLSEYGVLQADATASDIVDLDLLTLENGLLAHSSILSKGSTQLMTFPIHYETLCDSQGHRELATILKAAPTPVQNTIILELHNLPDGVPESRLATLLLPLRSSTKTILFSVPPTFVRDNPLVNLAHFKGVGVSMVVVDLPARITNMDTNSTIKILTAAKKLGLHTAVTGVVDAETLQVFKSMKVGFYAGPLFGGPFFKLPRAHRLKGPDLLRPINRAFAEAKSKSYEIADWAFVAEKYGLAFTATQADSNGVPRFLFASDGVRDLTGYEPQELVGAPVSMLQALDIDKLAASSFFARLNVVGEASVRLKNVSKEGAFYGVRIRACRPAAGGLAASHPHIYFSLFEQCGHDEIQNACHSRRASLLPQDHDGK